MTPFTVTHEEALRDPMAHRFRRGIGHVRARSLRAPLGAVALLPPHGSAANSFHRLAPGTGGAARTFKWAAGHWFAPGGNRLGWSAEYMGGHGWVYIDAIG